MAELLTLDLDTTCSSTGQVNARPSTLTLEFTTDLWVDPGDDGAKWRGVLVDKDGAAIRTLPEGALLGPIDQTLNEPDSTEVVLSPHDPAAGSDAFKTIAAKDVVPEIELQVYRDKTLMFFGPLTDDGPGNDEASEYHVKARGADWHLSRRHVGKLGLTNYLQNPNFDDGLAHWQVLRLNSIAGFYPSFGVPDFTNHLKVSRTVNLPGHERVLYCNGPVGDPNDFYQVYQDVYFKAPDRRELTIRMSAYVWVAGSEFGYANPYSPNMQQCFLLLGRMPVSFSPPYDYYLKPIDTGRSIMAGEHPRQRWVLHECKLVLPPGKEAIIHASLNFPAGNTYAALTTLHADAGLDFYDADPGAIVDALIDHAQDPAFGKDSANLGHSYVPTSNYKGYRIDRTYKYDDHTNVGNAIGEMTRDGYFDVSTTVTPTQRYVNVHMPRRGGYRPRGKLTAYKDGRGNVVSIKRTRRWSSGDTAVAVQSSSNTERYEGVATLPGNRRTLEEVFTALRETPPSDLDMMAAKHLVTASQPEMLEVQTRPDATYLMYAVNVGDTVDVYSEVAQAPVSGVYRVVKKRLDPLTDTITFTLNPDGVITPVVAGTDAPVAVGDSASTAYEVPFTGNVLTNDTGVGVAVTGHTSPAHGVLTIASGGAYTYTPNPGWSGVDSFTYTITDSYGRTSTATVAVTTAACAATGPFTDTFTGSGALSAPWVGTQLTRDGAGNLTYVYDGVHATGAAGLALGTVRCCPSYPGTSAPTQGWQIDVTYGGGDVNLGWSSDLASTHSLFVLVGVLGQVYMAVDGSTVAWTVGGTPATPSPGSVVSVAYLGGVVYYAVNGTLVATYTVASDQPSWPYTGITMSNGATIADFTASCITATAFASHILTEAADVLATEASDQLTQE